jgi:Domain of unknown function (DUF4326)
LAPTVVNMRGRRGVVPQGAVYVGRSTPAARTRGSALPQSPFANPFSAKRLGSHDAAVEAYAAYLDERPELIGRAKRELRGKDLACWCAPEPCHADLLVRIANG